VAPTVGTTHPSCSRQSRSPPARRRERSLVLGSPVELRRGRAIDTLTLAQFAQDRAHMSLRLRTKAAMSAALLALGIPSLSAQEPAPIADSVSSPITEAVSPVARSLGGALLGGTAGVLAGGIAGLYIGGNRCSSPGSSDSCYGFEGMLAGAAVGMTVGTPVGAHLMNRRRGALPYSLLTSVAVAAAGVVAFRAVDAHARGSGRVAALNSIVIAVPVLQVLCATLIESRSSRR